ncbi:MAG: GNAT family N-acetyltransferase [Novosphingobium sp.]|nr:GNAT family N-acetyltransferase [Novosphingobium sp.]MCP5401670.1 GNAT family N-acetyltransferase [Novosphingobium sp.]
MIQGLRIVEDDLSGEAVMALLQLHLDELYRLFPADSIHALPAEKLREPGVTFYSAWDGERLAGCGAIKRLDSVHCEIKSMRAGPDYRGRGVGKAILLHLLAEARRRGYRRASLETGTIDALLPARRLYEAHGFIRCPPFADYREDPLSVCMTMTL